jgi:hypothetical protein
VDATTEEVRSVLEYLNLRPATTKELLSLTKDHPDAQRVRPLVALGSVWQDSDGVRRVPYLNEWRDERFLLLRWVGSGWFGSCAFVGLDK